MLRRSNDCLHAFVSVFAPISAPLRTGICRGCRLSMGLVDEGGRRQILTNRTNRCPSITIITAATTITKGVTITTTGKRKESVAANIENCQDWRRRGLNTLTAIRGYSLCWSIRLFNPQNTRHTFSKYYGTNNVSPIFDTVMHTTSCSELVTKDIGYMSLDG